MKRSYGHCAQPSEFVVPDLQRIICRARRDQREVEREVQRCDIGSVTALQSTHDMVTIPFCPNTSVIQNGNSQSSVEAEFHAPDRSRHGC